MAIPKKKPVVKAKKRKGKVVIKETAKVRKKGSEKRDTIPKMETQLPRDNGAVFRVKIKRK